MDRNLFPVVCRTENLVYEEYLYDNPLSMEEGVLKINNPKIQCIDMYNRPLFPVLLPPYWKFEKPKLDEYN